MVNVELDTLYYVFKLHFLADAVPDLQEPI